MIIHLNANVSLPAGSYMSKVKNRNTKTRCQICSKLTIKIPCYSTPCSSVSIVNFEQLNAGWDGAKNQGSAGLIKSTAR